MHTSLFVGKIQGWLISMWYGGVAGVAASAFDDTLSRFGLQGLSLEYPRTVMERMLADDLARFNGQA